MSYTIEIDFAPAYELVLSLKAFTQKSSHKSMDLGSTWVQSLKKSLTPTFLQELTVAQSILDEDLMGLDLFVRECPGERTPSQFLKWMGQQSIGDLLRILSPYMDTLPTDFVDRRDRLVYLLTEWNAQYFCNIDPAILSGLEKEAERIRQMQSNFSPEELFEQATNGIHQIPTKELKQILLVPQHHLRPLNQSRHYKGMISCLYAADAVPPTPGHPSFALMRLTRCLADESRMRLLQFMALEQRSFSELVTYSGLAKSTVHHHLTALRAAGLVRLHAEGTAVTYSFREEVIDRLGDKIKGYLLQGGY